MCEPMSAMAVLGGIGTAMQFQQGRIAEIAQREAASKAAAAAAKQADQTDQANNRANAKQPDVTGLSSANSMAAKGGQSGTLLTGAAGVDPKTLLLGKTTLLGG